MSDESVHAALRSDAPLVLVEAPAGCGKTHQGAEYARDVAMAERSRRPLILTHTHAACSVFAERTQGLQNRVDVRTIDSVIAGIASAYHAGLGLPQDIPAWVRQQDEGYAHLALKIAELVKRHPMIPQALARRHPVVICDEHQDSSGDQHTLAMALLDQGARLRIFADPMQKIFRKSLDGASPTYEWNELKKDAQACEKLDFPHRWKECCPDLGKWTLAARDALKSGGKLDLKNGYPPSVIVVLAENEAQKNLDYRLSAKARRSIDLFEQKQHSLLILTRHNDTARAFRAFFNRRIQLWEGHTRAGLEALADTITAAAGGRAEIAAGVMSFVGGVGKGFSASAFGDRFETEVSEGCTKKCKGKPATIQALARFIVDDPTQRGVARMLRRLLELRATDPAFADIEIDGHREFWDAVKLGDFDTPDAGLAEITHRRTYSRPKPPEKAISTIHKAKGLECENVIVMPCDAKTFPDKPDARCLLYVAISRARSRLLLVVSRDNPSPLLAI